MSYQNKFIYQSNQWYNDGLKKANIRDLSGAITSLRKSLQYNRANIAARNLLGLVYYGQGEVAEALVEWVISNNMQRHENIAKYYIKKLQENENELETVNQAIRKYNQCLTYCEQGGEDLAAIQLKKVVSAHPNFLKAYQLLALIYLHTEQYAKAKQMLRKAHKIDTTNDITLTYMHELTSLYKQREAQKDKDQSISYNIGNETIIQPMSSTLKDNAAMMTVLNIVIGILMGAAVIWFLVVPTVKQRQSAKTNKEIIAYSDQIAASKSEIEALQKTVAEYESTDAATQEAKKKAENTQANYEKLVQVIVHYAKEGYSWDKLEKELLEVDASALGEEAAKQYEAISKEVFESQCKDLFEMAQKRYDVANYKKAIEELERVIAMDEGYSEGKALLLLADCYNARDEVDKAKEKYERVIELYKDTKVAKQAQESLDELKAQ